MTIILNISKPKEPTKSLADEIKGGIVVIDKTNSPLAAELKKPVVDTKAIAIPDTTIPQVTGEKYALIAEASDTLSQETIDQFNQRMRMVELSMDNPDLHNAMDRVITYCQEHNELRPFLRAEDIALFVKGARNSYAKVAEVKNKNRAKKSKSALIDEGIMAEFADIVIEL